jgi:2-polyprenyl-3-methyl-5-hydroxy-6-metoxy-1,4-benzoquinol methylase
VVDAFKCNLCFAETPADQAETTQVRSDIRKFVKERFRVWRCAHCRSIHSADEVDLAHYYAGYPFHNPELDWRMRAICGNMLGRLRRAGLQPQHHLLDYGCGGGTLIAYLRECGYPNAVGYDEFQEEFKDPRVLERQYDFVVSQDVIEHVLEPWDLLRTFDRITAAGGVIAIGTPNAETIDLARTDHFVHALHQPFHTHLLSRTMLIDSGTKLGWKLHHYYDKEFINTLVPFVNLRFAQYYVSCFDDTMDAAFDVRFSWRLLSPLTLLYGFFGYFLSEKTGGMAVFVKPKALNKPSSA